MVERPLHRVEATEHSEEVALRLPIARPSARATTRSARSRRRRASGRARPPLRTRWPHGAPAGRRRRASRARRPAPTHRQRHRTGTPCRPTRRAAARPSRDPRRRRAPRTRRSSTRSPARPPRAATHRRRRCEAEREAARGTPGPREPARSRRCRDRLPEHRARLLEAAGHEERLAVLGQQPQPAAMLRGQQGHRAPEQRHRARHVAACERAPARRGEAPGALLADLATAGVERAELGEVATGLLEVVAEDLLELDAAILVRDVGPRDEALVEVCPCALEDAVVGGVPDHDVVEAVDPLLAVLERVARGACARGSSAPRRRAVESSSETRAPSAAAGKW